MTTEAPLISCLCVTHNRVAMLARAIRCFDHQSWQNRELVLLHEDGDTATRDFLVRLQHPRIRTLVVPTQARLPLGSKRQLMVEQALGSHVATWDDDDWSGPTRLAEQMRAIQESGRAVCMLEHWIVHDQRLGESWLSQPRPWEASMVALRSALPPYEPIDREEDLRSMRRIAHAGQLVTLKSPHLYVYLYHGGNVGSRVHFKRNIFAQARKLPPAFARRVEQLLADAGAPALTLDEFIAAAGPGPAALRP